MYKIKLEDIPILPEPNLGKELTIVQQIIAKKFVAEHATKLAMDHSTTKHVIVDVVATEHG